ncbi:HlyU family transcriptional regulator [Pseudopelagicola sp. nBUS_19]|uniref:HlyU family transcriptional regulator n=1 Tax=Pseudopelagicola sp. nBUS_19 TaxID=3395316 RepID=UPI003EBBFDB7
MSFLKKLFGGNGREGVSSSEVVEHEGFMIYPEPTNEGGTYRVSARIEKVINDELRSQRLLRADTSSNEEEASRTSILKAKQVIDERGEKLFDGPSA